MGEVMKSFNARFMGSLVAGAMTALIQPPSASAYDKCGGDRWCNYHPQVHAVKCTSETSCPDPFGSGSWELHSHEAGNCDIKDFNSSCGGKMNSAYPELDKDLQKWATEACSRAGFTLTEDPSKYVRVGYKIHVDNNGSEASALTKRVRGTFSCAQIYSSLTGYQHKSSPPPVQTIAPKGNISATASAASYGVSGTSAYLTRTLHGTSGTSLSNATRCPAGGALRRLADGSFRCDTAANSGIVANRGTLSANPTGSSQPIVVVQQPQQPVDPTPAYTPTPQCTYVCSPGGSQPREISPQANNDCGTAKGGILALILETIGSTDAHAVIAPEQGETCTWSCPSGAPQPGGPVANDPTRYQIE